MKKIVTLLAAAGMVAASTAPVQAADVKLDGFYRYSFQSASTGFQGKNLQRNMQRMRLGLTITASENLSGYTQFQIGTTEWGTSPKHGLMDVQSRQYYIDWTVPGAPVKVRMGRQALGLPADAFGGNNFLGSAWGPRDGIVVTAQAADWLDVTALWTRAAYTKATDSTKWAPKKYYEDGSADMEEVAKDTSNDVDRDNSLDVFGLAANMKFNGFAVAPWVAYASMGEGLEGANGYNNSDIAGVNDALASDTYAFGATATVTAFDPFKLVVSASYATRDYDGDAAEDRKGYSVEAKASYKLGFGTPILAGWYTSGDDADDAFRNGWMPGINSYSSPTGTFFDGSTSLDAGVDRYTTLGTWGVQLGIEGMSFISGLSHDVTATWIQGTNHKAGAAKAFDEDVAGAAYLTTGDSTVELALTTNYKIYKNLTACLELAYLINDFDNSAEMVAAREGTYDEDDWRAGLTFTYKF